MAYTPINEFELNTENRMERKFERVPLGFAQNPRNPNVDWRIYYIDVDAPNGYRTASNLEYPNPEDAPVDNVACILQYMTDQEVDVIAHINPNDFDDNVSIGGNVVGDVYFINEFGRWQGGWGPDTLADRDARSIEYSAVKKGYWTDNETFRRVMGFAGLDTDFPSGMVYPEPGEDN